MTPLSRKAATLRALVRGSSGFATDLQREHVADELTQFINCATIKPLGRRRLLQFLHASRALETTLLSTCQAHGLPTAGTHSMKVYLSLLANASPPAIPQAVRNTCATRVADVRNHLAHGAGSYPAGDQQLSSGFDAARVCMALILS